MTTVTETPAEPKTKTAAELTVGDWLNDDYFGTGPIRVAAPIFVNADWAHIVYLEPGDPEPGSATVDADQKFQLATAAEIERMENDKRRAEFVRELRDFAAWFEARPWLPVPQNPDFQHSVLTVTAEKIAEIRAVAERLGAEFQLGNRVGIRHRVGGVEYRIHGIVPEELWLDGDA